MSTKLIALSVTLVALALAACGGQGNGGAATSNGGTYSLPSMPQLAITASVPANTIGEELPFEGLGSIHSTVWKAVLGGFTQQTTSQALGFPPGTKITISNLSKSITHTLDFVAKRRGPPARFPANPSLSIPAKGDGKLESGYASGPIAPGKSVTVTLVRGTYLIGCAYHYLEGMRDVIVVKAGATPGPQATPPT